MQNPEQKNENITENIQEKQKEADLKKIEKMEPTKLAEKLKNTKIPETKDMKDPREKVVDTSGKYQQKYLDFVKNISNDPDLLKKVISEAKLSYVTDQSSFTKSATDYKLGDLHEYLKNNFPTMEAKDNSGTSWFRELLKTETNDWVQVLPRGHRNVPYDISKHDLLQEMKPIIENRVQQKGITMQQATRELFSEWKVIKTGLHIDEKQYTQLHQDKNYLNKVQFLHDTINS